MFYRDDSDHFDELASALREADRYGINAGVVIVTGLQRLAGEENLTSKDIVTYLTTHARHSIREQVLAERTNDEVREYMARFEPYLGTLPAAVQNEMRNDLIARFRRIQSQGDEKTT